MRAAAVYLDAGRAETSRARLAALAHEHAADRFLRVHLAEQAELDGDAPAALAAFRALVAESEDAEVRARAAALARELGLDAEAREHFEAAERILGRAVDAGEVYTLGALARLYAEAGVKLEEALELAQRNLEAVGDAHARETLDEVKAKLADGRETE